MLNKNIKTVQERKQYIEFTFVNTNSRSLCPKINSLIDTIEELDAAFALVTETWLADGTTLEDDKQDLLLGAGLTLLCKNRKPDHRGVAYGGVGLLFKDELCSFKQIELDNPGDFEILTAIGSIQGLSRKVALIGCYIPPNYTTVRATACLNHIEELVIEMKRRLKDPLIIVTGDFNQWKIDQALQEFRDLTETTAGPTRGNRVIDRTFSNFDNITEAGILDPLQTEDIEQPRESDHKIFYMTASIRRKEKYRWLSYTYRYNNEESSKKFGDWIVSKDWAELLQTPTSNAKAELYQKEINTAIETFFPLRTTKRRSTDPPWINPAVKKLIKGRKRVFKDEGGRKRGWREVKKKVNDLIKKRCKKFQEIQKKQLLAKDGDRVFYKQTKNYLSKQRPKPFDLLDMFPGQTEADVAEKLAGHFNTISNEFTPLDPTKDIPITGSKPLKTLEPYEVAARLKRFKKPKSMVRGDIFPELVTKYADFLAVPLTAIYNDISSTKQWPRIWKEESVTIIPKTRNPTEIGQLRNISCTMLASKIFESFVLEWTLEQVKLKDNQFGGTKGCSAAHLLVSVWQNILEDLEDCRAGTLLTAIDYAKAFNRMQFQECLKSLARHGASTEIIQLIATFLSDRNMSVRVGSAWSRPRCVNGGVPQGSILGVLLYNVTTDNLEDSDEARAAQPEVNFGLGLDESLDETPETSSDEDIADLAHSTPITREVPIEPDLTPFRRADGSRFVFLDKARNVRRALTGSDITVLRDRTIPEEPNPVTSAIWKPRATGTHKYIDDSISDTKLNFENEPLVNGTKDKLAMDAQNTFRRTIRNAELIGMKANTDKTKLLLVSDSLSFKARAHFRSIEGTRLESGESLKLLGFTFGPRPTCQLHVDTIKRSFRGRYWLLIHMKQHYYSEQELVKAYKTLVRPIAEYCSVVFHSMLSDKQDEEIERLQATALRYIFGYGIPYSIMREKADLPTLRQRRIDACDKFAANCITSERFGTWFPEARPARASRHTLPYKEFYARCDRLRNSSLFYMRRRMNGKEGKTYGKRNERYRNT